MWVAAVSTRRHLRSATQGDLIMPRARTVLASVHEAFQSLESVSMGQSAVEDEEGVTDTRTVQAG